MANKKKPWIDEAPKNSDDMHKVLVSLLEKPWDKLSPEEKEDLLQKLPAPSRDVYNAFHKSMGQNSKQIPDFFKQELWYNFSEWYRIVRE